MYQKIIIVGNLGRDPEMRYMPDGTAVTNFSVATTKKWSSNGEPQEQTTWFNIEVWGRQAETANQYLARGRKVLVEGEMKPVEIYTRKDGTAGANLKVRAFNVKFLSGRNDDEGAVSSSAGGAGFEEDNIPF